MKNQRSNSSSPLFQIAAIFAFVLFFVGNMATNFANQSGLLTEFASTIYSTTFAYQSQLPSASAVSEASSITQELLDGQNPCPVPPVPPPPDPGVSGQ